MSSFIDQQYSQLAQGEVSKKRADNVKALEEKQRQLELESFRRSEAIEAARREQLRKQRHNEKLLREAAEAAEHEEQEKIQMEREERERKRLRELEEQRKRIEQAKADEKIRQAAREKQLKEQRDAAAAVKAEEERRRQEHLEETAGERMKKSYDKLMDKLGAIINADKQMMEDDTAKRRRERQLASDAATALNRVKAIEHTLQKHREHSRVVIHKKIEKAQHENLDERFHVSVVNQDPHHSYLTVTSPQRKRLMVVMNATDAHKSNNDHQHQGEQQQQQHHADGFNHDDHDENTAELFHDPDEEMTPEKLRSILLVGSGAGGSYLNSTFATETEKRKEQEAAAVGGNQQQNADNNNNNKRNGTEQENDNSRLNNNTTSYFGTSVTAGATSPGGVKTKQNHSKRELKPLDFETWQKQREAEAELVSLSLEYQMRTAK